jgi:hypothetical protein
VPTFGPSDWRRLLADPTGHWRMEKSAYERAVAWEAARSTERGLPFEVAALLDGVPSFAGASLLLGVPEHQVVLDGGGHASQTDLWVLLGTIGGVVSAAIEAKAGEVFDRPVPEWLRSASEQSGKPARLKQLCRILGITDVQAQRCRYQLLHRPSAAILEAHRFGLHRAMFLVMSFVPDPKGFADYACFAEQLGIQGRENALVSAGVRDGVELWIGWLSAQTADEKTVRAAV